MPDPSGVLLTGATGYVGGRLLSRLETDGIGVTCLARKPEALSGRTAPTTRAVRGDALEPASLDAAFHGIHTAYYLIHSLGEGEDFARRDREAAANFGAAAKRAGVRRIVYLGGLGSPGGEDLSEHLRSRRETGEVLRASGVPIVELRASIVIGRAALRSR